MIKRWAILFILSCNAQAETCDPAKLAGVIGVRENAVATWSDSRGLKVSTKSGVLPCPVPNPKEDAVDIGIPLATPAEFVGWLEGKPGEFQVKAISASACGDGFVLCLDGSACKTTATSDLYFSKLNKEKLSKVNSSGRPIDIPTAVWTALEAELAKKLKKGRLCEAQGGKGLAGSPFEHAVQRLKLPKSKDVRVAIVSVRQGDSPNFVYGLRLVRGKEILSPPMAIECGPTLRAEWNDSLLALHYAKLNILRIRSSMSNVLIALDNSGQVTGHLEVSNGMAECD